MILNEIDNAFIGDTQVEYIYLGDTLIYPTVPPTPPTPYVILYTSTDDNIVTPHTTDVFGANIISNTYEDGQGMLVFDKEVTEIGDNAFWGCYTLKTIVIPDTVTTIGSWAFRSCSSLKTIVIPDSVITLRFSAFCDCSSLESVTIGNSVTTIEAAAFSNCTALKSINIPDTVTTIGGFVFNGCSSLSVIYASPRTAPTVEYSTFFDVKTNGILHYPKGSNYSSWLSSSYYYLGYYGWTGVADL